MKQILTLIMFMSTYFSSVACDCNDTLSVKKAIENSNCIFIGQVTDIYPILLSDKESYTDLIVELTVEKVFKGDSVRTIKIKTAALVSMCGYPFVKGVSYLVYSTKIETEKNDLFYASICGRTKQIANALYDISEFQLYFAK